MIKAIKNFLGLIVFAFNYIIILVGLKKDNDDIERRRNEQKKLP